MAQLSESERNPPSFLKLRTKLRSALHAYINTSLILRGEGPTNPLGLPRRGKIPPSHRQRGKTRKTRYGIDTQRCYSLHAIVLPPLFIHLVCRSRWLVIAPFSPAATGRTGVNAAVLAAGAGGAVPTAVSTPPPPPSEQSIHGTVFRCFPVSVPTRGRTSTTHWNAWIAVFISITHGRARNKRHRSRGGGRGGGA